MPLQDLTQEMQRVYKDLPVGLCYLDTDLRYIYINDWLAEINGIPAEEHLGRTIGELIPDVAAGVETQFRQVIDTGEPIIGGSVEAENSAQPGIKRHFQYSCYPVRSDDGEVIGISCVVEDVTVRNEALCESEDRFRDFVEAASDWFWEMDENLRFTYLADSLLEIGGSKPEDLLGKTWQEADRGYEDNEDWRRQLACLKARRVFRDFQYPCVMPDGSIRHYSTSGTPIFDRAGHFKGYRGVGSDITEHKRVEEALRESEARLAKAAEIAKVGYWVWDEIEDKAVYCSNELAKICGVATGRELTACLTSPEKDLELVHPADRSRFAEAVRQSKAEKTGYDIECRIVRPNGEVRYLREILEPVLDEQSDLIRSIGIVQDVTERKCAEEAVRTQDAWLRAILENAPIEIVLKDTEGRIMAISRNVADILGLEVNDFIGGTTADFLPGHIAAKYMAGDRKVLETGQPLQQEIVEEIDGSTRYSLSAKFPLRDESGETAGICSITSDITEVKQAEVRLRDAIESISEGFILYDADERFVLCNSKYRGFYPSIADILKPGAKLEDVARAAFENGAVQGSSENVEAWMDIRLREHRTGQGSHEQHLKDGRWLLCSTRHTPTGGTVGIRADITERKRAEEELAALNENLEKRVEERTRALRDSEARLKAILDNSPAAIYLKDLEGRFLLANKTYLNWDNLKLKDIQGKTSYEIFPKEAAEAYVSQDKKMIETRTVVAREVEQPLQGGSTRSIVVTKFPVLSPEGTLVAIGGIDVDITERKRLEGELLRQERMATLGQLTATVSHELRNPLGVIRTSNFILRAGLNGEVPRVKRALERIDRSVIRCDRIIDELLDFTRISEMESQSTPIDAWLDETLDEQALPSEIALRRDFGLPDIKVSFDRDRFRRAIINVFDNACQAMIGEAGTDTTDANNRVLTITTRKTNGRVEVVFEDSGPGIPPDVLPNIFEPLFSTKGFGVGLGLPVVKQIMERHGGGIEVETEEGRGSMFVLRLPTRRPEGEIS